MASLYCATHGRECERGVKSREQQIRQDGESVLIVKGKLTSGPWRCDQCNATLNKGNVAYLYAAYPAWITEQMDEYDFEMERDYFALSEGDRVTQYGAAWPGGSAAHMLGRSRVPRTRKRRALTATELFMPRPDAQERVPVEEGYGDDEEPTIYPTLALPPVYLLRTAERCPECGQAMHVYTLGCHAFRHDDDPDPVDVFHFLRQIESVPAALEKLLKAKCPGYYPDREREGKKPYWMNHCRCGAKLDDDFLHGDVGAAFWPEARGQFKLFVLPIDEAIPVTSSFMIGGDEFLDFGAVEDWQAMDA